MKRRFIGSLILAATVSCGAEDGKSGLDEPFKVENAQFVEGALPGILAGETVDDENLPTVTSPSAEVAAITERMAGIRFIGLSSRNAASVGVRFAESGSGYYLFPTGSIDPTDDNALTWSFIADLQLDLPPGRHEFLTVAFDEEGHAGQQATSSLCVRSLRPDNGNACFPAVAPPAFVLSVEWDTPVDLDLVLVLPNGQVVDAKNPAPTSPDDPLSKPPARLVYDGNGGCTIDGRQREDIVFDELPAPGRYQVYVNLARNCGEHAVTYQVSRHSRTELPNDEYGVDSHDVGAGTLIADQANGGTKRGTYVGTLTSQ